MDELQEAIHKFDRVLSDLRAVVEKIDPDDPDGNVVKIALAQAKRVRRESNLVVRALARYRDNLHTQEGDNKS